MISALFLAIFTLIVLLVDGLRGGWRPALRDAGYLSVAGLVALVAWAPALFFIVREFFTASYDLQGWGDALMLAARGRAGAAPESGLNAWLSIYPDLN